MSYCPNCQKDTKTARGSVYICDECNTDRRHTPYWVIIKELADKFNTLIIAEIEKHNASGSPAHYSNTCDYCYGLAEAVKIIKKASLPPKPRVTEAKR